MKIMLFPEKEPEITSYKGLWLLTLCLLCSQSLLIYFVYVMYYGLFEKPFILLMLSMYLVIFVYGVGFILDNSPLMGVSSLFICYLVLYCMDIRFIEIINRIIIIIFIISLFIAAYIKDKYSHELYNKKPIMLNVVLYMILGVLMHAIPVHIHLQNSYYRTVSGFQML